MLRFRIPLIALTVLITLASAYQARTKLRLETSFESFASSTSEARLALDAFRATFGRDDMFLVVAEGDVFSMPYLTRLKALHSDLEALEVEGIEPKVYVDGTSTADRENPPVKPSGLTPATATGPRAGTQTTDATTATETDEFADFGEDEFAGVPGGAHEASAKTASNSTGQGAAAAGKGVKTTGDAWGDEAGGTIIDQVVSLITIRKTEMKGGALTVGELMDPMPTAATLPAMKKRALAEPTVLGQVLGERLRHSLVAVRTLPLAEEDSDLVFRKIEGVLKRHETPDFKLSVAGQPALTAWMKSAMLRDMQVLLGSALLVMLLVLVVLFRHPVGVVGPIAVIVMSVIWTVGMMATVGMPMTVMTTIMPSFLFAVGLGDAVHLVSVYRDLRRSGLENHAAVEEAVSTTGLPLLFTSMTTAMGLFSFNFAVVDSLAQMGTAAAFGVGVALLHSLVFLPIVLSFNHKSLLGARAVQGGDRLDQMLWTLTGIKTARANRLTATRSYRVLGLALLVAVVAGLGISKIGVSHNPVAWLPKSASIRTSFDTVDREVGGTAAIQLLITANGELGIKDLRFLRALEKVEQQIGTFRHPTEGKITGASVSLLDAVRETNRALHGGDMAWYRLPDSQRAASDLLFLFESSGPDDLRRMATTDLQMTQMTIRVKWLDAHSYVPLAEHIRVAVKEHFKGIATVRTTGSTFTLTSTVAGLINDTLRSFGAALLVITLFMMLLLRDIRLGLVSMVPNLLPIAMVLGFMGFMGIGIDMGNLMLASVGVGIAVDDTIHFLHHFRVGRSSGLTTEQAIAGAVQHAGRAMVGTTLVLTLGFSVFLTGSMVHLQRFGGLIALIAACALFVDLLLAPALLRVLYGHPNDEQDAQL